MAISDFFKDLVPQAATASVGTLPNNRSYNADYYQRSDESLQDYLARIQSIRAQGILSPQEAILKPLIELNNGSVSDKSSNAGMMSNMRCPAGYVFDGSACVPSGGGGGGGDSVPEPMDWKEYSLEDMVRQKTDQDFDPFYGISAIPGFGAAAGGLFALARNSAIESELRDLGYSEKDIDFMMDNKEYLMSELVSNKDAGFKNKVDYEGLRDLAKGGLLGSIFGSDTPPVLPAGSAINPFAVGRVDPYSNVQTFNPLNNQLTINLGGSTYAAIPMTAQRAADTVAGVNAGMLEPVYGAGGDGIYYSPVADSGGNYDYSYSSGSIADATPDSAYSGYTAGSGSYDLSLD